jgi:hypothetical protein
MIRKLLAYWNVALLLVALSQCNQCRPGSVEDMTDWALCWDEAVALGSSLPPIGVENGIVCHVPSEDAVYILAPTGECHKFTQTSRLVHERIASFSGITGQESFFAFPAGSLQAQTLHVGVVNKQKITLHQYKEGIWQPVGSYDFDSTTAWPSWCSSRVTACSIPEANQCNGLIVLTPNSCRIPPVVLCYDADKRVLESSSTWRYMGCNALQAAIAIAPSAILVSEENTDTLYYWAERDNKYEHVQAPYYSPSSPSRRARRASLFLLYARKLMPQAVYARFIEKNGKTELRFYAVTHTRPYAMQPMHDLPATLEESEEKGVDNRMDHSESLIVPFSEVVYVVTKDKDGQYVYYKSRFQKPAN